MNREIYTEDDIKVIKLIKNGTSKNAMCYELDWSLTTLKARLAALYALAGVQGKTELRRKLKGLNLKEL